MVTDEEFFRGGNFINLLKLLCSKILICKDLNPLALMCKAVALTGP